MTTMTAQPATSAAAASWTASPHHLARKADPIPPEHLTRGADIVVRMALALMPFSAIAWTFIAH